MKLFTILIGSVSVFGCISLSTSTEVNVWSFEKTTEIRIATPTAKINFNWHGGGWYNASKGYVLSMPRGKSFIEGRDITLKLDDESLDVAATSSASIDWADPCTVSLSLNDARGKPYEFNGVYKVEKFSCRK